jgi:hypothetical protein
MNKPTHISEYVNKHMNRIRKRNAMRKKLEAKYGKNVHLKLLTNKELEEWTILFNKKRGNHENHN